MNLDLALMQLIRVLYWIFQNRAAKDLSNVSAVLTRKQNFRQYIARKQLLG